MVLEALEGSHPRLLLEEGRSDEFVDRMADGLDDVRRRLRAAPGHLPHDRLPHERVPRPRGRRALRARGGEPDDRRPRRAALHARARPLRRRARGDPPRLGRRAHEPARDAAVRPHRPASSSSCRALVAASGLLDRPGFELWVMAEVPSVLFNLERYAALGVAGISIGSNDLTQLLLGADRDSGAARRAVRRARPGGRRLPARADPEGTRASGSRPRSAGRRRRCIPSTRSCSSAPGSTRSRSTSTRSTARAG